MKSLFSEEELNSFNTYKIIVGLDEAGRGPLAGPVSAAAVILPDDFPLELLDDSKALSEKKRNIAFEQIVEKAMWANEWAYPSEIDKINILNASMLAMRRAFLSLIKNYSLCAEKGNYPEIAIVDGNKIPDLPCNTEAVVKADAKFPSVMAASIVAKVCRDRLMTRYSWIYPEYGYEKHKGYPTKNHRDVCLELGPSPIQRMSFTVKP